jgi:hypothetical protein
MTNISERTVQELEERVGHLYDLAELAKFCRVRRPQMRTALERAGVPIIQVERKQLVPQELAAKALGLDFAELLVEVHRNEQWMTRQETDAGGRRKTVAEYAEEMSALVRQAIRESTASTP